MSAVKDTAVSSAVETGQETPSDHYPKSAHDGNDQVHNSVSNGPYEIQSAGDDGTEYLGDVIHAIEEKKKVWYAYLTT